MLNKNTIDKLYSYFLNRLNMRNYRRGWLKGDCPSCGKHDKFGINLHKDKTNCFVCDFHLSPLSLVMYIENISTYEEVKKVLNNYNDREYIEPAFEEIPIVDVNLPEGYTNIALGDNFVATRAREYIKSRGFKVLNASMKGWGYCTEGEYFGYIILPFYVKGKLVYFNARRYIGSGPKYKNPPIEQVGIGKSLIIYNIDALYLYKDVYLIEGLFNAETLGNNAIASGGKKVSAAQISIINKSPVEDITIVLDPDAKREAVNLVGKFMYHKNVKLVYWEGDKDINDLGKKATLKIIEKFNFLNYNDFLKLKHEIEYERPVNSY